MQLAQPGAHSHHQRQRSITLQQPQAVARRPRCSNPTRALPATPATDSPLMTAAGSGSTQVPNAAAAAAALPAAASAAAAPRYLSYQEYLEARQQQQEQDAGAAGQRADETAHASTSTAASSSSSSSSSESSSPPGKRVPWNKGRKHSAMTIARISAATARALARPEVRSKLDAWNQSRVGSKLPEDIKARISERQRQAMAARRERMSQDELEEHSAKRSALARRLWQDPEYAARTVSAIQDAGRKRRGVSRTAAAAEEDSSSSSSTSSSRSGSSKQRSSGGRRRSVAVASGSSEAPPESGSSEAPPESGSSEAPPESKERQPTQKELAALAKLQQEHQREQLQKQLDHMLQTQRLIATTEATLVQLRSNMAAFENNPQAKATAAQALRQAEAYLDPARQRVAQLLQSLDEHGVHWDPVSGAMTHIHHQPLDGKKSARSSSSSSSSSRVKSSSRSGSTKAASGGAADNGLGPDVVRSSRSKQVQQQEQHAAAAGLVVSSRRRATADTAAAAAAGGSSSPPSSPAAGVWTPVSGTHSVGSAVKPANGSSSSNGKNGHHGSGGSTSYVPLSRMAAADEDEEL